MWLIKSWFWFVFQSLHFICLRKSIRKTKVIWSHESFSNLQGKRNGFTITLIGRTWQRCGENFTLDRWVCLAPAVVIHRALNAFTRWNTVACCVPESARLNTSKMIMSTCGILRDTMWTISTVRKRTVDIKTSKRAASRTLRLGCRCRPTNSNVHSITMVARSKISNRVWIIQITYFMPTLRWRMREMQHWSVLDIQFIQVPVAFGKVLETCFTVNVVDGKSTDWKEYWTLDFVRVVLFE